MYVDFICAMQGEGMRIYNYYKCSTLLNYNNKLMHIMFSSLQCSWVYIYNNIAIASVQLLVVTSRHSGGWSSSPFLPCWSWKFFRLFRLTRNILELLYPFDTCIIIIIIYSYCTHACYIV